MKKALIIVDVQNDFVTGSLKVPNAEQIINPINLLIKHSFNEVIYTLDWHPENHISFNQWGYHCVQFTYGAKLFKGLIYLPNNLFFKGYKPDEDCYSGFGGMKFDGDDLTTLDSYLRTRGIDRLVVVGLATDYCVKATVIDACKLGYSTVVYLPGCTAVDSINAEPKAISDMIDAGSGCINTYEQFLEFFEVKSNGKIN